MHYHSTGFLKDAGSSWRASDEGIERLKQEAQGIELKRHGADLLSLCPFHDDHEPSLVLSPKKNLGTVWCVPDRGLGHRLGHAEPGRELPSRGRFFSAGYYPYARN